MKRPGNEKEYRQIASAIRQDVVRMISKAGTWHVTSNLDIVDILVGLYFGVLKHEPRKPDWPDRDRVFVSNPNIAPALYATLAHSGYFAKKDLLTFAQNKSTLQGTPSTSTRGVECAIGSLGNGLGIACGAALALAIDKRSERVYCLLGDGEHNEGAIWEAVMFAAKNRLSNLTAIIDRNGMQKAGQTEIVMPLESLRAKYEAFNWQVIEVDGHNICHIMDALNEAKAISSRPTVIIAHTIPGKGAASFENRHEWSDKTLSKHDEAKAIAEISHDS